MFSLNRRHSASISVKKVAESKNLTCVDRQRLFKFGVEKIQASMLAKWRDEIPEAKAFLQKSACLCQEHRACFFGGHGDT